MIRLKIGRLSAHSSKQSCVQSVATNIKYFASRQVGDSVDRHLHELSRRLYHSSQHSVIQRENIDMTEASQYARINEKLICQHVLGTQNFSILQRSSTKLPMYQSKRFFGDSVAASSTAAVIGSGAPIGNYGTFLRLLHDNVFTEFFQSSLLSLHSYTGLPWWANIILVTLTVRTFATLPLALFQEHNRVKVERITYEMDDIVKQLKAETNFAVDTFGWSETYARRKYNHAFKKQWNKLVIRDNCHPFKGIILVIVQFPIWLTLSASLRNLCFMLPLPTPALQETFMQLTVGGFGWISDLTAVDSYWVLPILLGLTNLLNIEIKLLSSTRESTKLQRTMSNIFRGISIMMVPVAGMVPTCIGLYWVTSSAYGVVQNVIVVSPRLRRFVRIPESKYDLKYPYQHLYNNIKKKYGRIANTIVARAET